jgi:DNA-binding transcriptional MerR regulator
MAGGGFTDADLDWLAVSSKLRATGMSVRDMQRYAELVRSGAGEQHRLELLRRHRAVVVQAIADSQECLQLLDDKIGCDIRVVGEEQTCEELHSAS